MSKLNAATEDSEVQDAYFTSYIELRKALIISVIVTYSVSQPGHFNSHLPEQVYKLQC